MDDTEEKLKEFRFRGFGIPERMHGGILRYLQRGILPGGFLRAIICNDLKEACGQADDENLLLLPAYVSFFYNCTSSLCWGSKEKMNEWHERFQEKVA